VHADSRREQSQAEEIANSVSHHGAALVAALVGTPPLILDAARHANTGFVVGASIFAVTAILLYLASTLYHTVPAGRSKRVFGVIGHSAILLLWQTPAGSATGCCCVVYCTFAAICQRTGMSSAVRL
jgi:hemolysin III